MSLEIKIAVEIQLRQIVRKENWFVRDSALRHTKWENFGKAVSFQLVSILP